MQTLTNLRNLNYLTLLIRHDWHYEYSDSRSVYDQGFHSCIRLDSLSNTYSDMDIMLTLYKKHIQDPNLTNYKDAFTLLASTLSKVLPELTFSNYYQKTMLGIIEMPLTDLLECANYDSIKFNNSPLPFNQDINTILNRLIFIGEQIKKLETT